jgi:hypothetical protein
LSFAKVECRQVCYQWLGSQVCVAVARLT